MAFIFNQKFFKDLQEETRIDLENIVYYKDDTHYFVMTAKKASLLEKGVIKQDLADTERLLAPDNVDRDALENYAREAANFSTNYQMPDLEFAVNHYGQPDVAMFDFTSMYAAENASKVLERNGYRLLMILVGDSLLEVNFISKKRLFVKYAVMFLAFLADWFGMCPWISVFIGCRMGNQKLEFRNINRFGSIS